MADEGGAKLTPLGKILSLLLIVGAHRRRRHISSTRRGSARTPRAGVPAPARRPRPRRRIPPASPRSRNTSTCRPRGCPRSRASASTSGTPTTRSSASATTSGPAGCPVIAANHGTKPNADSIFSKKYGFKVEMVLMDDPVAARDAFAAGEVHTLWGTADMMVLLAPELMQGFAHRAAHRAADRLVQRRRRHRRAQQHQVRRAICRGKTITLAQNSPSEYYLTSLLLSAGLRPADVKAKYTATAFEAAAAFVADKTVDACVSWAPDIYNIPERVAGHPHPVQHRRRQQADRRRLRRPRRLRARPSGDRRRPGRRHLRGHGHRQGQARSRRPSGWPMPSA